MSPLRGEAIPAGVLERMACSADFWLEPASEEKRALHRALKEYAAARETGREAALRAALCELFASCHPDLCRRFLTEAEHEAVERCAAGGPFAAPDRAGLPG